MRTPCPDCGYPSLTYNGNYYCLDEDCGWIHTPWGEDNHDPAFEKALVKDLFETDRKGERL